MLELETLASAGRLRVRLSICLRIAAAWDQPNAAEEDSTLHHIYFVL